MRHTNQREASFIESEQDASDVLTSAAVTRGVNERLEEWQRGEEEEKDEIKCGQSIIADL